MLPSQKLARYGRRDAETETDLPRAVVQANLDLQRFEEAEKDATDALRSDPHNLKASYRRGRARFLREEPDRRGACMDLTRVVAKDPTNEQVGRSGGRPP